MGSNPGSDRKSTTAPRALHSRLPTAPSTLGWVKCREHISLLIILCIIVYVTNEAHPSLICVVLCSAVCFNFAQHNKKHWVQNKPIWAGKIVHLGFILPSTFDCLFNPSLMDDLTQLMALFVSIIIFVFLCFFLLYA